MSETAKKLIRHPDQKLTFGNMTIVARDGVFTPDPTLSYSTAIILENLPNVFGKTVLDIGTGTGVVATRCALNGATHVVAADVSGIALQNAQENFEKNGVSDVVETRTSNVFDQIPDSFDYIFANLPIKDEIWEDGLSPVAIVTRFIAQVGSHLNVGGVAYFVWGLDVPYEPILDALKGERIAFERIDVHALDLPWTLFVVKK